MSKAEELAQRLTELTRWHDLSDDELDQAAAHLRALDASHRRLLEALNILLEHYEKPAGFDKAMLLTDGEFGDFLKTIKVKSDDAANNARTAIAAAKELT